MSATQPTESALVATIDGRDYSSVSFAMEPIVNGCLFHGHKDRVSLSDLEKDGWAEHIAVTDEPDSPELRLELAGILERRFESTREAQERQKRIGDKREKAGLPRRVLPIGAPAPPVTLKMLQKARYDSTEARNANIAYFKEHGVQPEEFDEYGKPLPPPASVDALDPDSPYDMTAEEIAAEDEKEYPVYKLKETAGPRFDDEDLYGVLGGATRMICKSSEASPAAVYMNLIVFTGSMFGRGAYFNVDGTQHFTNEFLACVGSSSTGRKGTSSDGAEQFLRVFASEFIARRVFKGFSSPQAVIEQIKDASSYSQRDKKTGAYKMILVPGVDDKRLCVRESELSGLFKLISDKNTKAGETFRDSWDSKPLSNLVAGKTDDGASHSLKCNEPHLSIIGSTTPSLVKQTLPYGADTSGDGNRFLWCYVKRTQLCPHGGPPIDWASQMIKHADRTIPLLVYLQEMLNKAYDNRFIPFTDAARKFWTHLYRRFETDCRAGYLAGMTSRTPAHIRRVATILCLVDMEDAVSVKHLKAAEAVWNFSQESAQFIFAGYSLEQEKILRFAQEKGVPGIKIDRDLHALFGRHKSSEWLRAQISGLVEGGHLIEVNGFYQFKKW